MSRLSFRSGYGPAGETAAGPPVDRAGGTREGAHPDRREPGVDALILSQRSRFHGARAPVRPGSSAAARARGRGVSTGRRRGPSSRAGLPQGVGGEGVPQAHGVVGSVGVGVAAGLVGPSRGGVGVVARGHAGPATVGAAGGGGRRGRGRGIGRAGSPPSRPKNRASWYAEQMVSRKYAAAVPHWSAPLPGSTGGRAPCR